MTLSVRIDLHTLCSCKFPFPSLRLYCDAASSNSFHYQNTLDPTFFPASPRNVNVHTNVVAVEINALDLQPGFSNVRLLRENVIRTLRQIDNNNFYSRKGKKT
ncbi:2389_t:CDS:1 [Acaulospora morrowiae]|uniref:2389_t:CDS:1 n=1 Tax=Acaulospora morrowiae TaxID=94023 RepID=A0A9N8V6J0_9GLOM|nr:2389_t:CDS:1 [Acaulospora morrowiae]